MTPLDDEKVLVLARDIFKNTANVWLGGTYDGQKIVWLDGSPDVYKNFVQETQPGNIVLNLVSGKWSTATWNVKIPFICSQNNNILVSTTASQTSTVTSHDTCPNNSPCPSEWTYAEQLKTCYKTIFNMVFTQANETCISMGASLASIHSEEENRIINQLFKIGLPIGDIAYGGLIGGKRTGRGASEWMWIDGTPWDFTEWALGEPNFHDGEEFCLEVYNDRPTWGAKDPDGDVQKWNDVPCSKTMRSAICKKTARY